MNQRQWELIRAFCDVAAQTIKILDRESQGKEDTRERRETFGLLATLNEQIQGLENETDAREAARVDIETSSVVDVARGPN